MACLMVGAVHSAPRGRRKPKCQRPLRSTLTRVEPSSDYPSETTRAQLVDALNASGLCEYHRRNAVPVEPIAENMLRMLRGRGYVLVRESTALDETARASSEQLDRMLSGLSQEELALLLKRNSSHPPSVERVAAELERRSLPPPSTSSSSSTPEAKEGEQSDQERQAP